MDENIIERRLVEKFAEVVSTLDVSKYNDQAEYRKIIGTIGLMCKDTCWIARGLI